MKEVGVRVLDAGCAEDCGACSLLRLGRKPVWSTEKRPPKKFEDVPNVELGSLSGGFRDSDADKAREK